MSRKRGITIGSAWSWSDGISTAGIGGAAAARVVAVDGVGCGRGIRGGVLTIRTGGRGAPPGPSP